MRLRQANRFANQLRTGSAVLALSVLSSVCALPQNPPARIDTTFVFTADTHVAYNGTNDMSGILWDGSNPLLIGNETPANQWASTTKDGCMVSGFFGGTKDLCNQIQQIRKMNLLPKLEWKSWNSNATTFKQAGHTRQLASSGYIATPAGVLIGGDLTDCGGGVDDGNCNNGDYGSNTNGAELHAFKALYDKSLNVHLNFDGMPFLSGLKDPNSDTPLHYPIYPGYGNHDLQFSGSYMKDYMVNFVLSNSSKLTNYDNATQSYSFDLNGVHIVNAGVYPGSGTDQNLDFDQDSMKWFKADLATYASDGRPVIIYSHFGFDTSESLTNAWWLGSNRVDGLNQLWSVIRDYNVIGYFHGHEHSQWGWYTYPAAPALPYDIFLPGAGFEQDFAVVHVTNTSMDVMMTSHDSDYVDGSDSVAFNTPFTKQLVGAPVPATSVATAASGSVGVSSVQANGTTYLLGVSGLRSYTLQTLSSEGVPTTVDHGVFDEAAGVPESLNSYIYGGQPHFIGLMGSSLVDYVVGTNNKMTADWTQKDVYGGSAIAYNAAGTPLLIVDNSTQGGEVDVYQIGASSATLEARLPAKSIADPILMLYNYSNSQVGLMRANSSSGIVEFDALTLGPAKYSLTAVGTETWPKNFKAMSVPMANGSTQILVTSAFCTEYDSSGNCLTQNTDSPYYIRTILPDNQGTDISWRGYVPGMMPNASAIVLLDNSGTAPLLATYSVTDGMFGEFKLQPGASKPMN